MKRLPLILLILANSVLLFAQSSMSDLYKQWMIEDVNKGNFEKAAKEMLRVDDWTFDSENQSHYIDINAALSFITYADSINTDAYKIDSLKFYVSKVSFLYGYYYYKQGEYANAIPYWELEAEIFKTVLGENHPDYAASLNNFGILYEEMGDYAKAEKYYLEALNIRKSVLGENHPHYASFLNNLGILYKNMGDYAEAEKYYLQALNIRKSVLGENHPDYAASLNNFGILYEKIGDYAKAEKYYLEALNIRKSVLGENHPDYAGSLNGLGGVYWAMGDYAKAEKYHLEALNIKKSVLGENHPDYAASLNNFGILYEKIGDYAKAEKYYLEAFNIQKSVLGENHPNYASLLYNLGILYDKIGDYAEAEKYHLEALNIRKSVLGENHPDYAASLDGLGYLYEEMGDYAEAEKYYLQALNIKKSVLGENHPDYAASLNRLGILYWEIGDYAKAEKYHLEALNIKKSVLGENHPDYATSLIGLGTLYKYMGNYAKAENYLRQTMSFDKRHYMQAIDFMTEEQRNLFWKTLNIRFIYIYPNYVYCYHIKNPSISTCAYDNELFVKGLLLNSSESIKRSILESGDTILMSKWNELKAEKSIIMAFQEKDPQSPYIAEHQERAEQLEKEITKSSAAYRENQAIWDITWDSVRNHLKGTDVAIEYLEVPLSEDSTMYCALLLRDTCSYPIMIPLFEEKEVLPLANATTNGEFAPVKVYDYTINGKELTAKIWSKIIPYIKPGETVYFAPSGLLHQLAIEALPYDSTHTMADIYNMVRLSSTREIVMHKNDSHYTSAALYGGIQYDVNADTLLAESRRYAQDELLASRGIEDDTLDRGDIKYLAWTKTEVEDINNLLQKNKLKVKLYTATSANEESFKALSGKHQNILHIATHGFFWTDSTAQKKDYFTQRMMPFGNDRPAPPSIDPLNRCGLLFAGAQTAWSGHSADLTEGVQDGILTAKEISLLDLRDADLVVLSACETGKGEITSDGVFGLQRAFKQAGAQTIIMSLWPVNDASTQLLMTEFYRNWITYHQSKREAFRNAQNAVRSQYEEPYYWAGFIMLD